MQLKYHEEAMEKGVFVVGSCGFDSIPSDVGQTVVHKAMEGPVNKIETYLKVGKIFFVGRVLRLRQNMHWQEYASFDSLNFPCWDRASWKVVDCLWHYY